MKVHQTEIPAVMLVEPAVFGDDRGFFMETWNIERYAEAGIDKPFVQVNHSHSTRGVLRGLHYQLPQPQGKLVYVVAGEIYDVAVDLRRSSPTFGRSVGARLSSQNKHQLWIPPGFAHGFYVLSDETDVIYLCTSLYAPAHDRTLRWDDPDLAVAWPLDGAPLVSPKDERGLSLREATVFEDGDLG